jgi:hypothetical protein
MKRLRTNALHHILSGETVNYPCLQATWPVFDITEELEQSCNTQKARGITLDCPASTMVLLTILTKYDIVWKWNVVPQLSPDVKDIKKTCKYSQRYPEQPSSGGCNFPLIFVVNTR